MTRGGGTTDPAVRKRHLIGKRGCAIAPHGHVAVAQPTERSGDG